MCAINLLSVSPCKVKNVILKLILLCLNGSYGVFIIYIPIQCEP